MRRSVNVVLALGVLGLSLLLTSCQWISWVVGGLPFEDGQLASAVSANLETYEIAPWELEKLVQLYAGEKGIESLNGIEHCPNLQTLLLTGNRISIIAPLMELTKLRALWLTWNQISDLAPLAGLTLLEWLFLNGNEISDIGPVARLTELRELWLGENYISDLAPLAGLTKIHTLGLRWNQISDITPLAGLTRLKWVDLEHNQLDLSEDSATMDVIRTLQSRGCVVTY